MKNFVLLINMLMLTACVADDGPGTIGGISDPAEIIGYWTTPANTFCPQTMTFSSNGSFLGTSGSSPLHIYSGLWDIDNSGVNLSSLTLAISSDNGVVDCSGTVRASAYTSVFYYDININDELELYVSSTALTPTLVLE